MLGGAYTRGGLIRGLTQVSRKRWAYLRRGLYAGGLQAEKYGILKKAACFLRNKMVFTLMNLHSPKKSYEHFCGVRWEILFQNC